MSFYIMFTLVRYYFVQRKEIGSQWLKNENMSIFYSYYNIKIMRFNYWVFDIINIIYKFRKIFFNLPKNKIINSANTHNLFN